MKKLALAVILALLLFGCSEKANTGAEDWVLSPEFSIPYVDPDGIDRDFILRGNENKLGITDAPLIVGMQQKVIWHFWGDTEQLVGDLKVVGTSAKTGKTSTLLENRLTKGTSNLGSTTSLPSGIELTSLGLWKLEVYINEELFDSIIVEGKKSY